jgi:tetratricopeptide (TPR) repeat protein
VDQAASLESWREQLALARKHGQRGLLINGVGNLGYAAFLAGAWDEALAEMDVFLAEEIAPNSRLLILNNALIIRASRGETIEAGLAEMASLGRSMSGNWEQFLQDPTANDALARGDLGKARDAFAAIFETDPGNSEYALRTARPALWAGDAADATTQLKRLEESGAYGPVADARLATVRAGLAALAGRTTEALALYRDALRNWRETHSVWDEALTGVDMAQLLDPAEPEVAAAVKSTRAILERLGARPYIERLDAAAGRAQSARVGRTALETSVAEAAVTE